MSDISDEGEIPLSRILADGELQAEVTPVDSKPKGFFLEGAELEAARLVYEQEEQAIRERWAKLEERPDDPDAEPPYNWHPF